MDPARLRDFCRLLGYVARRRWIERKRSRTPIGVYLPTSPGSLALFLAEQDSYGRERLRRIPEQPDRRPGHRHA